MKPTSALSLALVAFWSLLPLNSTISLADGDFDPTPEFSIEDAVPAEEAPMPESMTDEEAAGGENPEELYALAGESGTGSGAAPASGSPQELEAFFKKLHKGYRVLEMKKARAAHVATCAGIAKGGWTHAVNGSFFAARRGADQHKLPPNPPAIVNGKWITGEKVKGKFVPQLIGEKFWRRGMLTISKSGRIGVCQMSGPRPKNLVTKNGKTKDAQNVDFQMQQIQAQCGRGEPLVDVLGGLPYLIKGGKLNTDLGPASGQNFGGGNAGSVGRAAQHSLLLFIDGKVYVLQMETDRSRKLWNRANGKITAPAGSIADDILRVQAQWRAKYRGDAWEALKLDGGGGYYLGKKGCSRKLSNPTGIYFSNQ